MTAITWRLAYLLGSTEEDTASAKLPKLSRRVEAAAEIFCSAEPPVRRHPDGGRAAFRAAYNASLRRLSSGQGAPFAALARRNDKKGESPFSCSPPLCSLVYSSSSCPSTCSASVAWPGGGTTTVDRLLSEVSLRKSAKSCFCRSSHLASISALCRFSFSY